MGDDGLAAIEVRCRHADNTWHWLLIRGAVFGRRSDGTVHQVIATTTDITELKRAEEELRRSAVETYHRDPDVFDTWFSSSSWPYATLGRARWRRLFCLQYSTRNLRYHL